MRHLTLFAAGLALAVALVCLFLHGEPKVDGVMCPYHVLESGEGVGHK